MDYIKFAIDELEKQNEKRGLTAGMAREQYNALLSRLAKLETAEQGGYQTAIIPCPHCGVNVTIDSDSFIANR